MPGPGRPHAWPRRAVLAINYRSRKFIGQHIYMLTCILFLQISIFADLPFCFAGQLIYMLTYLFFFAGS